jgi:hypothetical protein
MTGGQPTTLSALYVANTGHVLAAFTRTDGSNAVPQVADVAGDGLIVRGLVTDDSSAPWKSPPDAFLVPAADLKCANFTIGPTNAAVLREPRAYAVSPPPGAGSGTPPPGPPALNPLSPFTTAKAVSNPSPPPTLGASDIVVSLYKGELILFFGSNWYGNPFYTVVVSQVTAADATPIPLNSFPGTFSDTNPISLATAANTAGMTYSVLLLVAAMRPVVFSF